MIEEEHKQLRLEFNTVKISMKDAIKRRDEAKEKCKGSLKAEELKVATIDTSHPQYHVAIKMLPFVMEAQAYAKDIEN